MRIGILLFVNLILSVCFNITSKAQTDLSQLVIEDIEFPDTVTIGEVQLLSGIVKNISDDPIYFDFDFGLDFGEIFPGIDFEYIIDELIPCSDCYLQPDESRSFSKPVYLSNQRVTPNQENVVIIWPIEAIGDEPRRGESRSRSFYVQDDSINNERNVDFTNCNNVLIEELENVIKISGLFDAEQSNISVVNQNHEVIYFCQNDCPDDEIAINIPDSGYYLVQVNLINGFDFCYDVDFIITESWLDYENYIIENDFLPIEGLPGADGMDGLNGIGGNGMDGADGTDGTSIIIPNPDINLPELPDINLPDINLPELPDINLPDINLPELPNINLPDINLPGLPNIVNQFVTFGCGIEIMVENTEIKFLIPSEGSVSLKITDNEDNTIFECKEDACNDNEIIVQLPELEEMKYTLDISFSDNNQTCTNSISIGGGIIDNWKNPFDICSNQALLQAPVINNIFQQSALVFIPGFFNDGSLQIKKEDAVEWQTIKKSFSTYLLSQLDECTTYEVRAAYICNNTERYSEIQTFKTQGCVECSIEDIDMQIVNVFGNTAIINWDIFSGVNYRLHYKKQEDVEWDHYETPIPFALLFNLNPCSVYEFFLEVICVDGIVSTPGEVIKMETGNCRNSINEKTEISIYPNVAKDFVNITVNNAENLSDVQIYDQAGALIQKVDGSKLNNNTYQLNINDFAKGIYVVHAIAFDNIYHSKFIKQ